MHPENESIEPIVTDSATHVEDTEWMDDSNCVGLVERGVYTQQKMNAIFWPERFNAKSVRGAKSICRNCDVRSECLVYGLQEDLINRGIFGGATPAERKRIAQDYPSQTQDIGVVVVKLSQGLYKKKNVEPESYPA